MHNAQFTMHNAQLKNWLNLFARIKGNAYGILLFININYENNFYTLNLHSSTFFDTLYTFFLSLSMK